MSKKNHNQPTAQIPPQPSSTGAILLILDKKTLGLQHSVINLQAQEALQTTRAFAAFLENVVIEQAKEAARQEALAQTKPKEPSKAA
jgi:hypothetical protein